MKLAPLTQLQPLPLSAIILSTIFGQQAFAAQELEEITVTATKRGAQHLQDIPLSVQAMSGEKLRNIGAGDFNDFFRFIPGLAVFDQGPGDKRYIIRGVNATGAGTVGLYLDEVIITGENAQDGGGRQPDIKLFDMERVEVLKGPQGTTFGSSSLSGTIRYITNKPNLTEKELNVRAEITDVDGADLGSQVEAAISLPLIDDVLAVRVAGMYLDQDGFIDNRFSDGVNSDETTAARISLLYAPNDNFSISLMAMDQDVETDGPAYYNRVDGNGVPLPNNTQADLSGNPFEDEMNLYTATLEYPSEIGTVTATLSRLERDTLFHRAPPPAAGPLSVLTPPTAPQVYRSALRRASPRHPSAQAAPA